MSMKRSNNAGNSIEEPSSAPQPNRWYTLTLGPSFKDHRPSTKFCTLRYGFKPASIDKSQPGTLHKDKDNRVTVDFQNNQLGKPGVTFEGVISDDYKENDAVLFFDGVTFRLERLHRSVKRLRLLEPAATCQAGVSGDASSPLAGKAAKGFNLNKSEIHPVAAEVERIDVGDIGLFGAKTTEMIADVPPAHLNPPSTASPELKNDDSEELLDIMNDDDNGYGGAASKENEPEKEFHPRNHIDINVPLPHDEELVDIDGNGDGDGDDDDDIARNLEEALGAAEMEEEGRREEHTSSSSGSSGSESSGSSGSGSSSSDGESSDDNDSVNSI
ncbi:hypothetical protein Dimus_023191 [Dionaea muscipula]